MRIILGLCLCLLQSLVLAETPDWENPAIFSINKEAPRATFISYQNEEAALSFKPESSDYYKLLNGNWKFHWSPRPADTPKDFYKEDFDVSEWNEIQVPAKRKNHL